MQVTFLCTDNEKFAYAYAMEKSIQSRGGKVDICVYGGLKEVTKRLSELRWLLVQEMRDREIDVELIDERVQFRVIENTEEAVQFKYETDCKLAFHVFPSKKLACLSDYVKFLIGMQGKRECAEETEFVIIDNVAGAYGSTQHAELVYSMIPPQSILTVASHPASRQFEVQRLVERGIVETIKMDWQSDRMTFG